MKKLVFLTAALMLVVPSALAETDIGTTDNTKSTSGTEIGTTDKTSKQGGPVIELVNPLGKGVGLFELLNKILDFIIRIGTIVVIFMLVYVGYLFVMARGEPGAITTAKNALLWTLVGALVLLGSRVIAEGIRATVEALSLGK